MWLVSQSEPVMTATIWPADLNAKGFLRRFAGCVSTSSTRHQPHIDPISIFKARAGENTLRRTYFFTMQYVFFLSFLLSFLCLPSRQALTSGIPVVSLVPPFKSERLAQIGTLHGPKPKRASPTAPLPDKLVSQLSRLSLFRLYAEVAGLMGQGTVSGGTTYREVKDAAREYQRAKWLLRGRKGAAFRGWEGKGRSREAFGLDGVAKGADPGINET